MLRRYVALVYFAVVHYMSNVCKLRITCPKIQCKHEDYEQPITGRSKFSGAARSSSEREPIRDLDSKNLGDDRAVKHSCPQWRRISFCYPHGRRAPRRRILDLYFTPSLNLIDFEPRYTTPMHSVLLIDEILEYILEFCSDWPQEEYRQTLACIARCCKAWRDPALDRLWYRLDGVMPLVRLLPGFVAGTDGSDAVVGPTSRLAVTCPDVRLAGV